MLRKKSAAASSEREKTGGAAGEQIGDELDAEPVGDECGNEEPRVVEIELDPEIRPDEQPAARDESAHCCASDGSGGPMKSVAEAAGTTMDGQS